MNAGRFSRRAVVGLAAALTAGLVSVTGTALPAAAATDGPPVIGSLVGQAGPTAGGTAIRIYGSGFLGTTSVKFGTVNATKFRVIDTGLITAVVPPAANGTAANNTSVDVTITDDQGVGVGHNDPSDGDPNTGWFYTNATFTVSPSTGLVAGAAITGTLNAYLPNTNMVMPELNPLMLYLEGGPPYPQGPPPYADPLTFPRTDATGHISSATHLSNPFNGDGLSYDPNAVCPVKQATANYLGNSAPAKPPQPVYAGKCLMAIGQLGIGTIDTPISFTTDPVPAAPVLKLGTATAIVGQNVSIASGSINWNANPFFGSSKAATYPGETKTTVQVCGIGGNANTCSTTVGSGTVKMTRYTSTSTTTPIVGKFSGATLSGSIVVGSDAAGCNTCFVRARQYRATGSFIEATAPLAIS